VTLGKETRLHRTPGDSFNGRLFTVPETTCAAFSSDGRWLALGGTDAKIRLFEPGTGTPIITLEGSAGPPRGLAASPSGQRLLSGGDDKIVHLWDIATGKEIVRFTQHTNIVNAVAFTPDGRYALSASADGSVRMWMLPREKAGGIPVKTADVGSR
jgi:WD40 repeat protein